MCSLLQGGLAAVNARVYAVKVLYPLIYRAGTLIYPGQPPSSSRCRTGNVQRERGGHHAIEHYTFRKARIAHLACIPGKWIRVRTEKDGMGG